MVLPVPELPRSLSFVIGSTQVPVLRLGASPASAFRQAPHAKLKGSMMDFVGQKPELGSAFPGRPFDLLNPKGYAHVISGVEAVEN